MTRKVIFAIVVVSTIMLNSCSINYSFTGASISPEVKTIRIGNFPNYAPLVNPTLSQELTDALRDKFQSQTSLIIVNQGGDLVLEGEITGYNTQPTAIQSDDIAALNRLTISLKVTYVNTLDETQSFEKQTFTRYEDYPSNLDFASVQDTYVPIITEYLVEDIFNKAVVNW
nr:LptE family protein [Bacteroidota bacterium]